MNQRQKKLIKYVLPSTLSMISVFLFTVIDGVFVGRGVGTDALGAVNLAFPYIMIFSALVTCTMVGGLTITAIRKGRGDEKGAGESFLHSVVMSTAVSALFCITGTVFVEPVAKLMGSNDTFFTMVCDYIFWYSVFMIPCGLCMVFNGFCRNDDDPVLVSAGTIIATTLNIFGDWLFVYPLHMGLKGAAIATGISQTIGMGISLSHFLLKKKGTLRFRKFSFDPELCKKILIRGLPECISQFNAPLCVIFTNIVLLAMLGDTAENAFSVIGYVAAFSVAAFAGVAEGLQPIFGNCYGAKQAEDLLWYRKKGLTIGFTGALLIYILLLFVGKPVCALYGLDEATMACTLDAMPKYSLGFLVQSFTVIISSYLYSTTKTKEAVFINVLRSFVLNTVVIFGLPKVFGPGSVWYTFPVYELLVLIAAVFVLKGTDENGVIGENPE